MNRLPRTVFARLWRRRGSPTAVRARERAHSADERPKRSRPNIKERRVRAGAALAGVAVTLFLLLEAAGPAFTAHLRAHAPEPSFKAYLDRTAPKLLAHFGVPGVVVSTVVKGAPAKTYAYGFADLERRDPMRADTVFRVASISKSLTAWGVLRLVQTRQVDLDAPVARYLSSWPLPPSPYPLAKVTVRRLLDHTAGVNGKEDQFRTPGQPALTPLQLLAKQGDGPNPGSARLVAPAGAEFLYSAPGYTLLALMIEEQSHRRFADFMKEQVLEPLGMTSSSFDWDAPLRDRTATAYLADGRAAPQTIPQDQAADSLFSTAPDLAKFVAAPLPDAHSPAGAGVLSARLLGPLYTADQRLPTIELQGLRIDGPGLGCFVERLSDGRLVVTNGGYDPGWTSQFYFSPSTGDGIVVLTNSDVGQPVIAELLGGWSVWRGLPAVKMTVIHYMLRVDVALALGLLITITFRFGAFLMIEIGDGSRRVLEFSARSLATASLECALGLAIMVGWIVVKSPVQAAVPVFYSFGSFAIGLFALLILARLLFPRLSPSRPSTFAALADFDERSVPEPV